jgi:hypothetical protein
MVAEHRLTASDHAGTEVELSFATQGLLGGVIGKMYGKLIADYVATEARSLKKYCEVLAAAASA